jgi:O-antigen ligase
MIIYTFLQHTAYTGTISLRNDLWDVAITAVKNANTFLFGVGLKSVFDFLGIYVPSGKDPKNWLPHSYYLYVLIEVGFVGLMIWIMFFLHNLILLFKRVFSNYGSKIVYSSTILSLLFVFGIGIVDMFFNFFKGQFYLFLILGIAYAEYYKQRTEVEI